MGSGHHHATGLYKMHESALNSGALHLALDLVLCLCSPLAFKLVVPRRACLAMLGQHGGVHLVMLDSAVHRLPVDAGHFAPDHCHLLAHTHHPAAEPDLDANGHGPEV